MEKEADETLFWLELIKEIKIFNEQKLDSLMRENDEIIAVIAASIKTARKRKNE